MRRFLPLLCLLPIAAQGAKLKLQVLVSRGQELIVERCECQGAPDRGELSWVVDRKVTPGSLTLNISGGAPPYRILGVDTTLMVVDGYRSVQAGTHRITVIDARGERVTRTVNVGISRRYQRMPCAQGRPEMNVKRYRGQRAKAAATSRTSSAFGEEPPTDKPDRDRHISDRRRERTPPPSPERIKDNKPTVK
ncbi:MAG TPA: hypothetical protein VGE21_11290 [Flavobacteriales bacterium]